MNPRQGPITGSRGTHRLGGRRSHRWLRWLALAALLPVAGCAGEFTTQSEPLRLLVERLPDAILNEPYSQPLEAVGGLRPYEFTVREGALPPGVLLEGGTLRGTPTSEGSYTFSIAVSDANLASTFERYELNVVTPPPPRLTLQPPATETRGAVTLRARVDDARAMLGLRTEISWDPTRFTLQEGSVAATRQSMALFQQAEPGLLRVDLALLNGPITGGAQLFTLTLVPVAPPTLVGVASVTEFASRRTGQLLFDSHSATEGPGSVTPAAVEQAGPVEAPGDDETEEPDIPPTEDQEDAR